MDASAFATLLSGWLGANKARCPARSLWMEK